MKLLGVELPEGASIVPLKRSPGTLLVAPVGKIWAAREEREAVVYDRDDVQELADHGLIDDVKDSFGEDS